MIYKKYIFNKDLFFFNNDNNKQKIFYWVYLLKLEKHIVIDFLKYIDNFLYLFFSIILKMLNIIEFIMIFKIIYY